MTDLSYHADDDVWQGTFNIPAGNWEYKAALNQSWAENYGAFSQQNGPNIWMSLAAPTDVKFYYDHETHWITDNATEVIAVAAGDFQTELGCSGDWDPGCLRSWLQNPDGNTTYSFTTTALPAGNYETKVAIDESWAESYGAGGVPGGDNILFNVPVNSAAVTFSYDAITHILEISVEPGVITPIVSIPGSFQSELGCPDDWQPECAVTVLGYDAEDDVWQETFNIPAGFWEYKAALNQSWAENYGLNAQQNGPNISLPLALPTDVKFYYDHETHWITDNSTEIIAVAAGDFQSELGCFGDWDPGCLRSWLQNPDGNTIYSFTTTSLPAGNYEAKVAIDESWAENYGAGGVPGGDNILFSVPVDNLEVTFTYNSVTHLLEITFGLGVATPIVTPSPSNEGQSVVASAIFASPGDGPFSCTVDYDDSSGPVPGTISGNTCTGPNHTYVDDNPSGTSSDDYEVTVAVTDDGIGTSSSSVIHTVNNVPPTISSITTDGPVEQGQPVTVTVNADDVGIDDILSYAFDCDNDGGFEVGPQPGNSTSCDLNPAVATSTIGVRVSDDDLGVTTGSVQVSQPMTLCGNFMTGALSQPVGGNCPAGSVELTLPMPQPLTLCINSFTRSISWFPSGCPPYGWITHLIPGSGPLYYCAHSWTGGIRAIYGAEQCTIYETPGVIPG